MGASESDAEPRSSSVAPRTQGSIEPEHLSLLALLARIPVGQLWAFIGILAGLVSGAFAAAWSVRGIVEDSKVRSLEATNTDLSRQVENVGKELAEERAKVVQLQDKDRFLSLYLRYVIARDQIDSSIPEESARQAFDEYIEAKVDRERLVIHKGGGRLATVEFADRTVWTLPPELHMVEKN